MPQIGKVLLPVDFSDACLGAARYTEALAGRFEAAIMLLHVVGMGEHNLAADLKASKQAQLDAFMADELKYFSTERVCVAGEPAVEIVAAARRWQADLVMIPTHGLGAYRSFLLGSVAAKILHDLSCPVWTSAHSEAAPPLERIHCRKILCGLDLSARSQSVLEWAAWLSRQYDADLAIVHAMPDLPPEFYGWSLSNEFEQTAFDRAEKQMETLRSGTGLPARIFIRPGEPAAAIAKTASDFDADLLVIGRHSGTGIGGYLRRHSYAIIRGSPCPVVSI